MGVRRTGPIGVVCGSLLLLASAVHAAEPAPPVDLAPADRLGSPEESPAAIVEEDEDGCCDDGPNRGRVWLAFNDDFTTAYFFRGILQERDGFIWQPSLDVGITLFE